MSTHRMALITGCILTEHTVSQGYGDIALMSASEDVINSRLFENAITYFTNLTLQKVFTPFLSLENLRAPSSSTPY